MDKAVWKPDVAPVPGGIEPEAGTADLQQAETSGDGCNRRAPRFKLVIRAAKLVCPQGEFVCVIRDVSSTGVSVKLFHDLPATRDMALELQNKESFDVSLVWSENRSAGFDFGGAVDIERLVREVGDYPKRGLRMSLHFPVILRTLTQRIPATVENISQQGARIECDQLLAIDQSLSLECKVLPEIRAKVRWRDGLKYGLVFDDTFTLEDLARLAARVQSPALLSV